ncbi:MAG: ATP-dependent protease, partial [Gammaproteobacteria bacterium]
IDMQVEVPALPPALLSASDSLPREESKTVKARVALAEKCQIDRQGKSNRDLLVGELQQFCTLDEKAQQLLDQVMNKFNLSARVYHRIVKVARTIADISSQNSISSDHISEALSYRSLDRSRLMI